MSARRITVLSTAAVVAFAVSLGGAAPAGAAAGASLGFGAGPRAQAVAAVDAPLDPRIATATDLELLTLLMTGRGSLADAHPELIAEFGLTPVSDAAAVQMAPIAAQFLALYPAFSSTWAPQIRSTDPLVREQGVNGYMTAFIEFVMENCRPSCVA